LQDRAEQIEAMQTLVAQQRAQVVVLSLGEEGALLATQDSLLQVNAPANQVMSAVGAGDSLVAGLVSGFLQGWPWAKSLAWASAVSAATVSHAPGEPWKKKDPLTFRSRVLLQTL
jgi:fructose-1-phosphate kinase PfkB-like protein